VIRERDGRTPATTEPKRTSWNVKAGDCLLCEGGSRCWAAGWDRPEIGVLADEAELCCRGAGGCLPVVGKNISSELVASAYEKPSTEPNGAAGPVESGQERCSRKGC